MSWSAIYRIGRLATALLFALAVISGLCDTKPCADQDHQDSAPQLCCTCLCHDAVPPDVLAPELADSEPTVVEWATVISLSESVVEGIDPPPVNRI